MNYSGNGIKTQGMRGNQFIGQHNIKHVTNNQQYNSKPKNTGSVDSRHILNFIERVVIDERYYTTNYAECLKIYNYIELYTDVTTLGYPFPVIMQIERFRQGFRSYLKKYRIVERKPN